MLSSLNTLAGSSILFPKKTQIKPPNNLTITNISETTISIQYDYVADANNYVITTSPPTTTINTGLTSYTITGLSSGILYTVYVRSQNTLINSMSSPVSVSDTTGVKTIINVNASAYAVVGSNTVFVFNGTSGFYNFGNIVSSTGITMRALTVAGGGGGGGGYDGGGGGGGGGVVDSSFLIQGNNWLEINMGVGGVGGDYGIVDTLGSPGFMGGNTALNFGGGVLANVVALGGGAGGEYSLAGSTGGSGGGAGYGNIVVATGTTTFNNNASSGGKYVSGGGSAGGGGAGSAGSDALGGSGGAGGAGYQSSITGSNLYWGGGGGGVSIAGNGAVDAASLIGPTFGTSSLYSSAVYAPSVNKIYSFPASATTGNVLVLDVSLSTFTSITNTSAYRSAVYAPNGKIYALESTTSATTNILIMNTLNSDTTTSITGINNGSSATAWENGILAPNGNIYFVPRVSTSVLIVNTANDTASTSAITGLAGADNWMGGVLGQNGKIYCAPLNSDYVMTINTTTNTANQTAIAVQSGTDKWNYGVAGPNGEVYFFPRSTGTILSINTYNDTVDSSFAFTNYGANSGVLAPNGKIYAAPHTGTVVYSIDPMTNGITTFGTVAAGSDKYYAIVAADNGILYGVPYSGTQFLQITPSLPTVGGGAAGGLGGGGGGAVVNYFGSSVAGGSGGGSAYSSANTGGNSAVVPIVGGGHGAAGTGGGGGGGTFKDAVATLNRSVFATNGAVIGTATFTNDCPIYNLSVPLANYTQKSMYFDGSTYVAFGNASNYAFDTATYECMFKVPVNGSGTRALMAKSGAYGLYLDTSNRLVAGYYNSGTRVLSLVDASFVNDNAWHHAALTYTTGQPSNILLYLDGIQKISTTSSSVLTQTTAPLQIGADNSANLFTGSIANARVWNVARSASDISANRFRVLRNCDVASNGLHGSYPLNDASSVIVNYAPRIGGYGGSGAVAVSVPTANIFKKNNYGILFRGSTGAIQCSAAATEFALYAGTVDCWIKTASAGSGLRALVVKPNAYGIYLNDGVLGAYDFSTSTFITSGTNVANSQWHHIRFIFNDRVANGSTLYIDQVLRATFTYTILNQSGVLGLRNNPANTTQGFLGQIYNVRIWNYAKPNFVGMSSLSLSPEMGLIGSWPLNEGVNTAVYNYAAVITANPATMPTTADFSWNAISSADYAPTQLAIVNVTETTATLNFQMNGYAVSYDITTTPTTSTWNITNNTFQFTGLLAGTNYTVNVYGVDKYGQRSTVVPATFKTFSNTTYYYKFDVGDFSNNLGIVNYKSGTAGAAVYDTSLAQIFKLEVKATTIFSPNAFSYNYTGGPNTFQNGTYVFSASSQRVSLLAYMAFDILASSSRFWQSDVASYDANGIYTPNTYVTTIQNVGIISGEWIQIKLPYQLVLNTYKFRSVFSNTQIYLPKKHYLVGSNNGTTWYSLDYYSGTAYSGYTTDGTIYYFSKTISNSVEYNYYRIVTNETYGGVIVAMSFIDLLGIARSITINSLSNTPITPVSSINSNTFTATSYGNAFQNGTYDVSASSPSLTTYYAFDSNPDTFWRTNYNGVNGYTQNPYDGSGNYVGGGGTTRFFTTTTQNAGTISGEFLQIRTPYASKITKYRIQSSTIWQTSNLYNMPREVSLLGSNNGTTWNLVDRQTTDALLPSKASILFPPGGYLAYNLGVTPICVALSADNARLFYGTSGSGAGCSVFDRGTGTWPVANWKTITTTPTTITACTMTADGNRVIYGNVTTVYRMDWSDASGQYRNEQTAATSPTTGVIYCLSVTGDGSRLILGIENNYMYFAPWDSGTSRYTPFTQISHTIFSGVSPNGRPFGSVTDDGSVLTFGTSAPSLFYAVWTGTTYNVIAQSTSVGFGSSMNRIFPDKKTIMLGSTTTDLSGTTFTSTTNTGLSAAPQGSYLSRDGSILMYFSGTSFVWYRISITNYPIITVANTSSSYTYYRLIANRTYEGRNIFTVNLWDISGITYEPISSDIYQVGNGSMNLTNTLSYLVLPAFTNTLTGFSTAFWVRGGTDASNSCIFDFGQSDASNVLSARFVSGIPRLFMNQLGTTYSYNIGTTSLTNSSWNHLAWSIAPSTGVWTAYLNSVPLTTGISAYPNVVNRNTNYVGKYITDTSNTNLSAVYVDDFRTFNSTIDSTQVANLYYSKTFVQGLQPINLTVLNITVNPSITLSFTANPNVTSYEILTSPPTQKWTTTNTTLTLTGLANSTTYTIYVYGLNDLGDRSFPATITVTMFNVPEYYYKFDSGDYSGSKIANYIPTATFDTSYSSTDMVTSPITTSSPAVGTGALYLNRTTQSNLILPNFINSPAGMSLSVWYKSGTDASNSVIFDASSSTNILSVRLYSGRPTLFLQESGTEFSAAIPKIFVDGSWNHLLWNIDSSGNWYGTINGLEYNMCIRSVTATLIDPTSATITYTALPGATSYQIRTVPQTTTWTTTNLSQVITGLDATTSYRVLVSALTSTLKKSHPAEATIR